MTGDSTLSCYEPKDYESKLTTETDETVSQSLERKEPKAKGTMGNQECSGRSVVARKAMALLG